jgi:gamma-glutamylcyclotransferase (GGCT)/AIG2-like uncharacterized protein YtfP
MMQQSCILNTRSVLRNSTKVAAQFPGMREEILARQLETAHTPDVQELEEKRGHLIFTYGTLKSGMPRNYLLTSTKSRFIAVGITNLAYSLFYQHKRYDERFPVLLPGIKGSPVGPVVGELWMVYPKTVMGIDRMERNGTLYKRLKMQIQVVSKPKHSDFQLYAMTWAWGWTGIRSAWEPLIELQEMQAIRPGQLFDASDHHRYIQFTKEHTSIIE